MLYAKIENNNIVGTGPLQLLFPNTSFPDTGVTQEWLAENSVVEFVDYIECDPSTQRLVYGNVYISNGKAYNCQVVDMTYDEQELYRKNSIECQWFNIRAERNVRLFETDWTVLADSPVDKEAWTTYRQQLRDITNQTDPFNINWPTKP